MDDNFYKRVANAETNVDDANEIKARLRSAFLTGFTIGTILIILLVNFR